jgi:peroxiredoxin family protein
MSDRNGLSLVVFAGGFDRVHYALVMASAAAATNRKTMLFFTGRAVLALKAGDGWRELDPADDGSSPEERNVHFGRSGLAEFEELLEACVALGVTVMVCEMALKAIGLEASALRSDVPVVSGGVVTFLNDAPADGRMLFV